MGLVETIDGNYVRGFSRTTYGFTLANSVNTIAVNSFYGSGKLVQATVEIPSATNAHTLYATVKDRFGTTIYSSTGYAKGTNITLNPNVWVCADFSIQVNMSAQEGAGALDVYVTPLLAI